MTLGPQFDEHRDTLHPNDIRVPKNRFAGITGLVRDLYLELPPQYSEHDLGNAADDIGDAYWNAQNDRTRLVDFPIHNLMAQHHINRQNARKVFESIKQKGYDPSEPIEVIADDESYGVIFNGHHRALAARAAGLTKIPAVITPFEEVSSWMPDDYK